MKDTEKRIGMADLYGTTATVSFWPPDDEDDTPTIALRLGVGQCRAEGFPTVEAARQLAAALLDAADQMDQAESEANA
jgi:hypothetical protein